MEDNSDQLPGPYVKLFISALTDAFRSKEKLGVMLRTRLNKSLHLVAPVSSDDMRDIAYRLFDNAEAEGWLYDLIVAVYQEQPENKKVASFYQKYQQFLLEQSSSENTDISPIHIVPPSPQTLPTPKRTNGKKRQQPSGIPDQSLQQLPLAFDASRQIHQSAETMQIPSLVSTGVPEPAPTSPPSLLYFRRRRDYFSASYRPRLFQYQRRSQLYQNTYLHPFVPNSGAYASL